MNVEIFCLCRGYSLDNGRPSIFRIFDTVWASGEPALVEPFVAFAAIRFFQNQIGQHRFQFTVKDPTGAALITSTEIVEITSIPYESTVYFMPCHMGQVALKFGRYNFSIESAGAKLATTPLYVVQGNTGPQQIG